MSYWKSQEEEEEKGGGEEREIDKGKEVAFFLALKANGMDWSGEGKWTF